MQTTSYADRMFNIRWRRFECRTLKKIVRRYRHNCGSLTYIILEIYRKPRFACISSACMCIPTIYDLLLQQYFWLTVKYILLNYLKTFSYIHMADKSQAFLSVYIRHSTEANIGSKINSLLLSNCRIWYCSTFRWFRWLIFEFIGILSDIRVWNCLRGHLSATYPVWYATSDSPIM